MSARHHVTSAVLLQRTKQQQTTHYQRHGALEPSVCVETSATGRRIEYLYFAEAVGTLLAVAGNPVLTQALPDGALHYSAAIPFLQEALPLLTATGIVFPQPHQPR